MNTPQKKIELEVTFKDNSIVIIPNATECRIDSVFLRASNSEKAVVFLLTEVKMYTVTKVPPAQSN